MQKVLPVKYPLYFLDFNQNWNFSTDFRKIRKYQISWKPSSESRVVPCGMTDRRTDTRKDRGTERERERQYDRQLFAILQMCLKLYKNVFLLSHCSNTWYRMTWGTFNQKEEISPINLTNSSDINWNLVVGPVGYIELAVPLHYLVNTKPSSVK